MNEIDNLNFQGLRIDHTPIKSTTPPSNPQGLDDGSFRGTVKTIINGILDDLSGKK
jgi:hypothetical protein